MAEPAVAVTEDEEYFSADEAATANSPPPRDFHTPLPPDVMEELTQITNKLVKFKEHRNPEVEDALQLFIQEWRGQTKNEIDELRKLKDRVSIRKAQRAEEEALLAEMRREDEEMRIRMAEEDKIRKQEDKLKRIQEAELRRQKLMEEQSKGRNFKIASTVKEEQLDQNSSRELSKEEYEATREAALSVIIKRLEIGGLGKERLKRRCQEMWEKVVKLETERYDLEEKRTRQEYDLKELKERQKQQLRQKALKLGLDPEALTGRYPPKIRVASKYERRTELKPFGETKGLFEGGFIDENNRKIDDQWHKRQDVFTKRNPDELPHWLADMPRQTIKQIEEEEAAIKAVILKEEMEAKEQPTGDDEGENESPEGEEKTDADEAKEEGVEEEEEEEEKVDAAEDEEGIEKKEIVITDATEEAASEGQEEEEEEEVVEVEEEEEEEDAESVAATIETATEEVEEEEASPAQEKQEEAEEEEEEEVEEVEEEEEEED